MGRLEGKVALITGAGSGMGRVAAILFAKEGAKVVVVDWVAEGGEETVRMIKEAGGEATFVKADVSRAEAENGIETAKAATTISKSSFLILFSSRSIYKIKDH